MERTTEQTQAGTQAERWHYWRDSEVVEAVKTGAPEILLILLVSAFVVPIAIMAGMAAHAVYREHHPYSPCSPQRYASLTASRPQPQRPTMRVRSEPSRHLAAWAADYAVARPIDVDAIKAGSITYNLASLTAPAVPELPPDVVPVVEEEEQQGIPVDWPTRIVQPVPLTRL